MSVSSILNQCTKQVSELANYVTSGRAIPRFSNLSLGEQGDTVIKVTLVAVAAYIIGGYIPLVPRIITVPAAVLFFGLSDLKQNDTAYNFGFTKFFK